MTRSEHAVDLARCDTGSSRASGARLVKATRRPGRSSSRSEGSSFEIRTTFETEFERSYVSWLLGRHDGNISAAAREAKMDRKYLYDLSRKHGLRGTKE